MKKPKYTFKEYARKSINEYSFYEDRIELRWRGAVSKGIKEIPRKEVSGRFSEQTTFGFGARTEARTALFWLILGSVLVLGFENSILDVIGWAAVIIGITSVIFFFAKLKKDNWIHFISHGGSNLFTVRERGLQDTSKEELIKQVKHYSENEPETEPDGR